MAMLEVIIGLIFTFMLLSLLGTTLNELVSAWRGWRGFYMEEALKRLLEFDDKKDVFEKFMKNPLFKQMMQHKAILRKSQAPAYLSSANFTSILTNVLKTKDKAVKTVDDIIQGVPEGSQLREVLEQFKEEGHTSVEAFKGRMQSWFDDIMSQSSGWYKRHLQFVTFFVGLGIAIVLNADSFQIYLHLTTNAANRQKLSALATSFAAENETVPNLTTPPTEPLTGAEIKKGVQEFVNTPEFRTASNILGLGWSREDFLVGPALWLRRLLGWFITALAVSLGAPFWFDVLKKIITIQSTGNASSSGNNGQAQVIINAAANTGDIKKA
ncbi:MAG: hypothetical protein IPN76_02870 [Saprospiraceae bacterium]|nr:hypothetical protein [Saprospiraceae bacterium]